MMEAKQSVRFIYKDIYNERSVLNFNNTAGQTALYRSNRMTLTDLQNDKLAQATTILLGT